MKFIFEAEINDNTCILRCNEASPEVFMSPGDSIYYSHFKGLDKGIPLTITFGLPAAQPLVLNAEYVEAVIASCFQILKETD